MPSRNDIDELSVPPAPADRRPLPPIGFWSYSRRDNELSGGKLSGMRTLLMRELQQQHGRESIHLFQDVTTIEHGEDWERVIRNALGRSSFFIPIITPNFLQSKWCAREVQIFREREKELLALYPDLPERSRIFPILYLDVEDIDPEDPDGFAFLQTLQMLDFQPFRHRGLKDRPVHQALADLAASIRKLLKLKVTWPDTDGAAAKTSEEAVHEAATLVTAPPPKTSRAPRTAPEPPTPPEPPPLAPERPIEIGDVLNHIFKVTRFIKAGGMGQVYEGLNINNGERVAIKVLLPALASDPKITQLFHREAMTLTGLSHEALVQYRLLAKEPQLGVLYIVMAFIDGVNLSDALDQIERSPEAIARLLRRLAGGLAAAHRAGAIHRDISHDNIMLPHGDVERAKIIDFGIAKNAASNLPTMIGENFAGKLGYAAPEQLGLGGGKIGAWTDVYGLALVILGVARGEKIAMGDTIGEALGSRDAVPDVSSAPEALRPLLAAMLNPDPTERLQSMDAVIAGLDAALAPPPKPKPQPTARRAPEPPPGSGTAAGPPALPIGSPELTVIETVLSRPADMSGKDPPNAETAAAFDGHQHVIDENSKKRANGLRRAAIIAGVVAAILLTLLLLIGRPPAPDANVAHEANRVEPASEGVGLTALGDVRISVREDGGQQLFSGNLSAGQTYVVPATAQHPLLRADRPHLLRISANGRDLGLLSTRDATVDNVSLLLQDIAARAAGSRPAPPPSDILWIEHRWCINGNRRNVWNIRREGNALVVNFSGEGGSGAERHGIERPLAQSVETNAGAYSLNPDRSVTFQPSGPGSTRIGLTRCD